MKKAGNYRVVPAIVFLCLILIMGCTKREKVVDYDFFENLSGSDQVSYRDDGMKIRRETLNLQRIFRKFIVQPAGTVITFYRVIADKSYLTFGVGMDMSHWKKTSGIELSLWLTPAGGQREKLYSIFLDPLKNKDQWGWIDQKIDLSEYAGKRVRFEFISEGRNDPLDPGKSGWAEPRIYRSRKQATPVQLERVVVTHTAVPVYWYMMDRQVTMVLGSYGHPTHKTPQFDKLSRNSMVFRGAITPSIQKFRSVGSFLTGLYSSHHGMVKKSRQYRHGIKTLAGRLASRGYSSAFLSNRKLTKPQFSLTRDFGLSDYIYEFQFDPKSNNDLNQALRTKIVEWLNAHEGEPHLLTVFRSISHRSFLNRRGGMNIRTSLQIKKENEPWNREFQKHRAEQNDANLGHFLDVIKQQGHFKNSLLVVTGTYSEVTRRRTGNQNKNLSFSSPNLIVPFLLRLPGIPVSPGLKDVLVSGTDVVPTVLDFLGMDYNELDGESLLPVILNDRPAPRAKPVFVDQLPQKAGMIFNDLVIRYSHRGTGDTYTFANVDDNPLIRSDIQVDDEFYLDELKQLFRCDFLKKPRDNQSQSLYSPHSNRLAPW